MTPDSAEVSAASVTWMNAEPDTLMERVLAPANLKRAYQRVVSNKGAPGADGMTVADLAGYVKQYWPILKVRLLAGEYHPQAVRAVEIPKPQGGMRQLGIPSVVDRLIQQALLQQLTPIFDPLFSDYSYGFRPGRSAHQAVEMARTHVAAGHRCCVELDLEKFFDRVNHDILISRVARQVKDKRLLKLIRAYLEAGIMVDGVRQRAGGGTPQGSPLSPLLSNIMLDDFDQEFWGRGHRFVRYADDIRVFVKSKRAAERVLEQSTRLLEQRLKLKVNVAKSVIAPAATAVLLGYGFYFTSSGVRLRIAPKAWLRAKARIRALTSRRWSVSMDYRVRRLNQYVRGWMGYFRLAHTPRKFSDLDEWYRRRLRQIRWKEWKRPRTRVANLRALGVRADLAWQWGMSSRGYWRIAKSPILHRALPTSYWQERGVVFFHPAWARFRTT